jgi:two-component system cell cycle sensor histidine kinase/response regulator CckA
MGRLPDAFDGLAVETTRLMAEFVSSVVRNAEELEGRRRLVEELRTQGEVVANMQTALWVWAPIDDGLLRLEYMNAATEEWTGRTSSELIGRTLPEILPGYHEEVVRTLFEVIASGEGRDLGEVVYGDERIKTSVLAMKAFPLPDGRVAVTFDNVTDRVRAHRALQESESRFRSAFDSVSVGMSLNTLDGRFVQANDRLANMLGYSVEELLRMHTAELIDPDDLEQDRRLDAELISGARSSYRNDLRAVRKDGGVVWLRLSVSLANDYEGNPIHFVTHIEDITDLKDAEAFFGSVFERSVVPKVIIDDERLIVDVNEAAAEMLGAPHDEAIGLNLDDFFPEQPVGRYWQRFLESGTLRAEATLRRPDGAEREIEFVATANVQPGRHIAVALDLTAQKALEHQLRQAQKMEAVGRLAGGIAHDFNNLLTAIAGCSEFLIAGIDEDGLRLHAEEIKRAAARAASLTGQLLAFSRRQVLQPRVLSLNAIVTDMDMMLRRLIGEDVELVTLLEPELGPVRADPTQIEQVIVNLVVNARDAMPHGGALRIETANVNTDVGDMVEFRLTDTGTGITPQQRQRLFDPFFTTKEGGTGLGLATVYGVVEQSGGTIEVESEPGLGTSFRIRLPRVQEPLEQPTLVVHDRSRTDRGTETILLVEDEAIVRQLVGEMLKRNGYTVLQAGDGPSALELLRRHSDPVELLITDVVMPGMSGRDVANAVTAMRPGIQVLYTSGYTDSVIGPHGVLDAGIAFLQKPFSVDDLVRKVRGLLDENHELSSSETN